MVINKSLSRISLSCLDMKHLLDLDIYVMACLCLILMSSLLLNLFVWHVHPLVMLRMIHVYGVLDKVMLIIIG
ncbi:hypothetical protein HanIR_Chr04g0194341 [Helianthus annuus]|nr:hypothetical protein HanIR_Chr04g0194341 [Helianthus annuus]